METITREDAEIKYTNWVIENGNIHFFVSKYLQIFDNKDLAEKLEKVFPGKEFNVVDDW